MAASITLNYSVKKTDKGTVSLTFNAVGYDISSNVFAIEVFPKSADPTLYNYRFSHVCSPAELIEFPENEPLDSSYFRTDSIELIFDTDALVPHVVNNMKHDVKHLVDEFNALEEIEPDTTSVTFE